MNILGINHINVLSSEPAKTVAFYRKLGFMPGPRPAGFPDPGVWLYDILGRAVLHINEVKPDDLSMVGGVLAHVGFSVGGTIESVTAQLKDLGIEYQLDDDLWPPVHGAKRALYFYGPSRERIEFVFVDLPVVILPEGDAAADPVPAK